MRQVQCDRMLEQKVAQILRMWPKVAIGSRFNLKITFYSSHIITRYLAYFCQKIRHLEPPIIGQSGHTGQVSLKFS